MPIKRGTSRETISQNISELEHSQTKRGKARTRAQNVKIALDMARKSGARIPKKRKPKNKLEALEDRAKREG